MIEEWLTTKEVGAMLRRHPDTVCRMVRDGRLKALRLGDGPRPPILIHRDTVEAFVHHRTSE